MIFNTDERTTLTLIDSFGWCTEKTCTLRMQRKHKKPTLAEIGSTNDRRLNLDYVPVPWVSLYIFYKA